ncbi:MULTISPECIES: redox-sensing transcriptional repressor Rex [unclassified Exiguobacterium]|uniref:redox-sensing transcriptional repressor Rex n=1 Tax=unclassified Exiguobacterium TaxID=2644629 RepID=UPI000E806D8A|nr:MULTISPECIES: redox-sensing transcriptional repressor Rex [unclassified Exiguobacterium]MDT0174378.1 redox-sensing transcriptional repressor Rex [Exiguobacterium sp. BRG2]HAL00977.1 redox-sensing transcriptional repressor Rex [Exiguobacterium sp.]HBF59697.1 redox-sensing transcriptional repressor Rex [Exiguobacterium sp.]HCV54231.1 redox-sensing transcriptional repressor Rex [Exiguobacterium sp.]
MNGSDTKIPQATAKRLPLYYRFIQSLYNSGKLRVSSAELSEAVKVDSATIRRDFSYFGALGKKGYGYNVQHLLTFFRKTLNQDEVTNVALIGVGHLGTAFANYNFLKNNSTRIVVAFDADEEKVGTTTHDVPIYHVSDMKEQIEANQVDVAILTVPSQFAQSVADELVEYGVTGILNFTPARLNVPASVRVHHIDLSIELQSLVYFMKHYSQSAEGVKS